MYANTETDWPISHTLAGVLAFHVNDTLYSDGRGYMEMLCAWVTPYGEAGLERVTCDECFTNSWIN